jgi:hypothetical protein
VQAEAGLCVGVVGDLGAAGGVERGVGLAGGDDLYAARAQQRAEADAERQRDGFFGLITDPAAGVVTAVSGVKHDQEAGRLGWWWRSRNGGSRSLLQGWG